MLGPNSILVEWWPRQRTGKVKQMERKMNRTRMANINHEIGNEYIGHCLKTARKALQMSRKRLAVRLDVPRNAIIRYEIGIQKIPEEVLTDLFCAGIKSMR
jgi:ribosome-binding protein aMBF1 (putative translation factor)